MEINNIFSLGFKVNADFSNFIAIDASTGAITATDIEQENACSFYVSMNTKKAKFLKVLKASNFNTGTVFFYDKDKKEYYCLRCQYVGSEEDVLAKNELIRIKYGRMMDRITDFD